MRARGKLRRGVEEALVALGQGFLAHPDNHALRGALQGGELTATAYYAELLRLVYRLLLLFTIEERGLLHPADADQEAKARYAERYSVQRLRGRSLERRADDRASDLWEDIQRVFRGISTGEPWLALPALAGIFARPQCLTLDASQLENRALLLAIFHLAWRPEASGPSRVSFGDIGSLELGRVHERLLELVPQITAGGRQLAFAAGSETKGNARKTTGSYYTPDGLVQVLLDCALEPVVARTIAAHPDSPAAALLELSIVDPACGCGHFLVAAARRLASHVARLQAHGAPSPADHRRALRQVIERCIYGVDLDPVAVALCKVSLWMEAATPGLPLTSLDAHVRHGNALLGATPELLAGGIPDAAWMPIEGDDKTTASALKKRNKRAALETTAGVEAAPAGQDAPRWDAAREPRGDQRQRLAADAWCAAFVWPKQPGPLAEAAPTNALWRALRDGEGQPPALTVHVTEALAAQHRFLHWHLEFPRVFARGGFDVVLGNPPWERVKLEAREFFASRSDEIAKAPTAAARRRLIAALPETDPQLFAAFRAASRAAEGQSHFVRSSGRYPLCGKGDVNTYALFAEQSRAVLGPNGRAGFVVPTGIATDDTTKAYWSSLVARAELASFFSFENEELVFPAVHHAFKFALLAVDRSARSDRADLVFFARRAAALSEPERHFSLAPADFALLNPNTRTCPTFRSRRDADINLSLYRRAGVLWREDDPDGNPWGLRFARMLDMANDSGLFRTRAELEAAGFRREGNRYVLGARRMLPLVEAKMIQHFDHRFGTYEGQTAAQAKQGKLPELSEMAHADPAQLTIPKYWVAESDVEARLEGRWERGWLLGWRDICRSTDQRTVIASLVPRVGTGDTFLIAMPSVDPRLVACLYANLCCLALDYAARQKVGGTHLKYHMFKQLPVLPPSSFAANAPWARTALLRDWLFDRVLELTYTAWDLAPFARDCSYDGPPFRWDGGRRFALRAELDAAFFHLYDVSRDDVAYILDTFPVVKKNDERACGEHRTRRAILEVYDAIAAAIRAGRPYGSPLTSARASS